MELSRAFASEARRVGQSELSEATEAERAVNTMQLPFTCVYLHLLVHVYGLWPCRMVKLEILPDATGRQKRAFSWF